MLTLPLQEGFLSLNTRAYHYNGAGSMPGPTLRAKPGDVVNITVINALEDTGADDPGQANSNTFHSMSERYSFYGV